MHNKAIRNSPNFIPRVPPVVTPGKTNSDPPSDAIILFDGKNLDQWVSVRDTTKPAGWDVARWHYNRIKNAG